MATKPSTRKKIASRIEPEAAPVVHSIKGFSSDLTCRGFQFEIGKTCTVDGPIAACSSGFHACTVDAHPLEVFGYYPPAGSRYCEVVQSGTTHSDDSIKIASAVITIGIEISIGELVKRAWDYVWSRAIKSDDAYVTITRGAASATGTRGAAISSYDGRVSGAIGNALFAIERNADLDIISVASGIDGRGGIKAGTWYRAVGGALVEVA